MYFTPSCYRGLYFLATVKLCSTMFFSHVVTRYGPDTQNLGIFNGLKPPATASPFTVMKSHETPPSPRPLLILHQSRAGLANAVFGRGSSSQWFSKRPPRWYLVVFFIFPVFSQLRCSLSRPPTECQLVVMEILTLFYPLTASGFHVS